MDGRVAMKGWPYMYAYVGLEPIQLPECRPADTIPTPPYMHPYVHPYILTIRYKALPPKSPYMVPYVGFESLISKFQVLRHNRNNKGVKNPQKIEMITKNCSSI
jgi:hypothetical protein